MHVQEKCLYVKVKWQAHALCPYPCVILLLSSMEEDQKIRLSLFLGTTVSYRRISSGSDRVSVHAVSCTRTYTQDMGGWLVLASSLAG